MSELLAGHAVRRRLRRRAYWRPGLGLFIARRLLLIPVSVAVVVVISFFLVALIPSSTAMMIAGEDATPERVAQITETLGLDKPIWEQFTDYLGRLLHFDLGTSFYSGMDIFTEIVDKIPASLELAIPSFALSILIGVTLGTFAAFNAGRLPDRIERIWSTALNAMPEFLLGVLGIYFIFFVLGWAPAPTGRLAITDIEPEKVTGFYTVDSLLAGDMTTFFHAVEYLALPVSVLALSGSVSFARITRAALSETMHASFLEYARSSGLPRSQIVRYALLDIRTPLMTQIAMGVGHLIGGAAIIETLFSWPGFGAWGVAGMEVLDAPVIQAFVLVSALISLLSYVLLDIATVILDPRVQITGPRSRRLGLFRRAPRVGSALLAGAAGEAGK